jgi:hypothetical protein
MGLLHQLSPACLALGCVGRWLLGLVRLVLRLGCSARGPASLELRRVRLVVLRAMWRLVAVPLLRVRRVVALLVLALGPRVLARPEALALLVLGRWALLQAARWALLRAAARWAALLRVASAWVGPMRLRAKQKPARSTEAWSKHVSCAPTIPQKRPNASVLCVRADARDRQRCWMRRLVLTRQHRKTRTVAPSWAAAEGCNEVPIL